MTDTLMREDVKAPGDLPAPTLSPNEERYVLAEVMSGQRHSIPWILYIRGPLSATRLLGALRDTCARHDSRRTGYEPDEGGGFRRYVEPHPTATLDELDLPGATEAQVATAVRDYCFELLDLTPKTLSRFLLIRRGPDDYAFGLSLHHATADGISVSLFMQEVFARYEGERDFPPAVQHRDFWDGDWSTTPEYRASLAYWEAKLAKVGDLAAFPADRALPPALSADSVSVRLDTPTFARLRAAAKAVGVTPFVFMLASYSVFLTRATGLSQACTTFQSGGRRGLDGGEEAIGVFSNGLIVNTTVDEGRTMRELCTEVRADVREALAHERAPYHRVRRATGVHPRFGINWFPPLPALTAEGLTISVPDVASNQNDYDLNLRFVEQDDELLTICFYREGSIGHARAQAATEQLLQLALAFSDALDAPVASVRSRDLLAAARLPDPAAPLPEPGDERITSAFLRVAAERPAAIALSSEAGDLTYGELERRARALAQTLRTGGVGAGDRVAIVAERGPALIWSLLGAIRLGAVPVVLDAAHPPARLQQLARIAAPAAVLSADADTLAREVAATAGRPFLSADVAATADASADGLDAADPAAPAYVVFTSGSTGEPKGVASAHAPLVHFIAWQAETFGLRADDHFTLLSGLSHDPVMRDIFAPLSLGATLLIPPHGTIQAPGGLAAWFRKVRPTVTHLTPAMGELLTAGGRGEAPGLRLAFWGGDRLRPALMRALTAMAPGVRQANFYGATETPQAVGYCVDDGCESWMHAPIGHGAAGAQLLVMGSDGQPKGVGELGEVVVRSNHLSLGYIADGRVLPPKDRGIDALGRASLYRTGDLGYHLPDGGVMLVGRSDDQVKVRGFRVHLSEVAETLRTIPGVGAVSVLAEDDQIRAFVAGRSGALDAEAVKAAISLKLPEAMRPQSLHVLERLPLLPNGKTDRQALLALPLAPQAVTAEAETDRERALIAAWRPLLGNVAIGRSSTFAGLGGDSLSYVQTYLATEELLGAVPPGWQHMTVADLARQEQKARSAWAQVELPMLLRAISITLIIGGHFELFDYGGGAVSAMVLVSGYLFGGLQLPEAWASNSPRPIFRTFLNVFVPTLLITYAIGAIRLMRGHYEPYIFTFTADFQDFRPGHAPPREAYLWYVHCMLHMLLAFTGLAWLMRALGDRRPSLRALLWGVFAVGCAGRFLLPELLLPGAWTHGVPDEFVAFYLPTTHISTLALGALIATVQTDRQRWRLVGVILVYAILTGLLYVPGRGIFIAAVGLGFMFLPRLSVPRAILPAIVSLSGASLFIYLCQYMFHNTLEKLVGTPPPALSVVVALAGGIAIWTLWNWLTRLWYGRNGATADRVVV